MAKKEYKSKGKRKNKRKKSKLTKPMEEQESYCDPGEKEEGSEAFNRIAELEEEIMIKTKSNELLQSEIRTLKEQQVWADTVSKQNKKKISDMITLNDEINIQIYRYLDDIELADRKRLDYVIAFNKLKYELELAGKENFGDQVCELEESVKIAREEKSKCEEKLSAKLAEVTRCNDEHLTRISSLNKEITSQAQYQQGLEAKIEELQNKKEGAGQIHCATTFKIKRLKDIISEFNSANDMLEIQIKDLNESSLKDSAEFRDVYEKKIAQLEKHIGDRIKQLENCVVEMEECNIVLVKNLESDRNKVVNEIKDLRGCINTLQDRVNSIEGENEGNYKIKGSQVKLENVRMELSRMSSFKNELEEKYDSVIKNYDKRTSSAKEMTMKVTEVFDEILWKKTKIDGLENTMKEVTDVKKDLNIKFDDLTANRVAVESEIESIKNQKMVTETEDTENVRSEVDLETTNSHLIGQYQGKVKEENKLDDRTIPCNIECEIKVKNIEETLVLDTKRLDTDVTELGIKVDSTSNLIQQQEAVMYDLKAKQEEDSKIFNQYKVQTEEIKKQLTLKIKELNEEVETLEKEIQNLDTTSNSCNKIGRNDCALKSNARIEDLVTRDLVEATSTILNYRIEVKELMVYNKELKIQIMELEKDDDQTTRTVIQLLIAAVIIAFHFYLTKAVN